MLHTALVISAYMSMIFIPCACAQWGDVLTAEWRTMRRDLRLDLRRRREGMSEALIRSLREAREAAYIAALAKVAFVEPAPFPRILYRARKLHMGRPRPRVRVADPAYFQRAVMRVRERLCALSESFRLAMQSQTPAFAMAGPSVSMAGIAPPMVHFKPARFVPSAAPPAIAAKVPQPAVAPPAPAVAPPAIAAQAVRPEIAAQTTFEDRLHRRLFDQAGASHRPAQHAVPQQAAPQELIPKEIRPMRVAPMPAAIEPSPLLHFPPSAAELEALFALESPSTESSDAVPVGVRESSAKISAAA